MVVGEEDVPRLRFAGIPSSLANELPRRDMFLVLRPSLSTSRFTEEGFWWGSSEKRNRPAAAALDIGHEQA